MTFSSDTLIIVQTNPLAVIGQNRVTSITVARLSALIPPSHFTLFHLPLRKLSCQQGLAGKYSLYLSRRWYSWTGALTGGGLTGEICQKPHLPACQWQSGISPLLQAKRYTFPHILFLLADWQKPAGYHSDCERISESKKVYSCILDQLQQSEWLGGSARSRS